MYTRKFKTKLAILATLCVLIMALCSVLTASAEEIPEPPETDITETETDPPIEKEGEEKVSITDIFYDKILPVIINVASGAGVGLVALVPLIKTIGSRNAYRAAYGTFKDKSDEYKELAKGLTAQLSAMSDKVAEVSQIDYKSIVKETIGVDLDAFKTAIKAEISGVVCGIDKTLTENYTSQQVLQECVNRLISGAKIAWGGAEGVTEILSVAPTKTALRREARRNSKYKEIIAQLKGEEADAIIAEVDAAVEVEV